MKKTVAAIALFVSVSVPVYLARDVTVRPSTKYDRIVSIVPSVSELLFAVGAGDQVVGVTTYCDYPEEVRTREKVGNIVISFEKVLALEPDVVMSSKSLARNSTEELKRRGFRVITVDPESFEEIAEQLRRLGQLTGHRERGEAEAAKLMQRVRKVEERVKGRERPTVYFESVLDPISTVGPDSYAGDAIRRAGGRNIMHDLGRPWARVSWEVVLARDPDVILIAHDRRDEVERRPGWSELKAVPAGRVHSVPRDIFVRATPRLADALELAAKLLHETD